MTDTDMPVFVLKAKDRLALRTIEFYRKQCLREGLNGQADEVDKAAREIALWQVAHRDAVQSPDHKHVPVGG